MVKTNASLVYSKNSIYSDDNSDGFINPGETIRLKVFLQNVGASESQNVNANFSSTSPYVTMLESSGVDYGDMRANAEKYGSYPPYSYSIKFRLLESTPVNSTIEFPITISDEHGNIWVDSLSIIIK